jgi:hypothetical protein
MADEPYMSAKFRVWAEFTTQSGKITFNDIVAVSASFALNTIPTASLIVAVGRNAVTGEPATIHDALKKLGPRDKVKVMLEITAGSGDTSKMEAGTYTIFDGFFIGIGYQRSENHANYTLNLVHWVDDLNNSSGINGNWFPGVPHDYAQQALIDTTGRTSAGAVTGKLDTSLASLANVKKDVWEEVLKPTFIALAGFSGRLLQDANKNLTGNSAALAALERMPGNGKNKDNYKPLSMNVEDLPETNFSGSLASYLSASVNDSFAQNSFWAKLVAEYTGQFLFALSPAVDWVLPIPFCAGLRWQDGGKEITARQYNYANFNANMSQIIESVDVLYALNSASGLQQITSPPDPTRPSYYRPCASWPPIKDTDPGADEFKRGLKLFKNTPEWLAKMDPTKFMGEPSTAGARHAAAPDRPGGDLANDLDPTGAAYKQTRNVVTSYAKQFYLTEVMQQRYGELSGPLRFDIAPGSIVKIYTPARDKALETDKAEFVIASVISVSYVINAERAIAGTSFAIAHTKTEKEAAAGSYYSTDLPPLYKQAWHGGPLAEKQ